MKMILYNNSKELYLNFSKRKIKSCINNQVYQEQLLVKDLSKDLQEI
jgi:hypothetical protein